MMALALEIQHGVDDMFERLRTRKAAILRHVAHEKCRNVAALRHEQQLRRRLADLADAAGRRLKLERKDRLHRIDDDERRLDARDLFEDALEARLGKQIERRLADGETFAARLDLVLRFLARAVEHWSGARHVCRRLEQQRRLADARLAAE